MYDSVSFDIQYGVVYDSHFLLQPFVQLKNSSGEDIREGVYVSPDEIYDLSGSRGTANFT